MTTPEQKANELVNKYYPVSSTTSFAAVKCAIIAVDEIIDQWEYVKHILHHSTIKIRIVDQEYWEEVKNQLNKKL